MKGIISLKLTYWLAMKPGDEEKKKHLNLMCDRQPMTSWNFKNNTEWICKDITEKCSNFRKNLKSHD